MTRDDLLEHARSSADFYELLGVHLETSESDIRRAYRKAALKYHPDKLGKDFDPDKFHLLQVANDVLSDPTTKAIYDNARRARTNKRRQDELFEGKRRRMKEDLEARERAGVPSDSGAGAWTKVPEETADEVRRLAENGKRRRREMEESWTAQPGATPARAPFVPHSSAATPLEQKVHGISESEMSTTGRQNTIHEEDEVAVLERKIREAQDHKARRKAEKKARKREVLDAAVLSAVPAKHHSPKKSSVDEGTQADKCSSDGPDTSLSSKRPQHVSHEFSATIARLRAAEKSKSKEGG